MTPKNGKQQQEFKTYCNIPDSAGVPCGEFIAKTSGLPAPEVGQEPATITKKFVQAIIAHLMHKHPSHAAFAMNTMEQYLAFAAVGLTRSEDPGVTIFMAQFADYLCKLALLPVTDEMIVDLVARMGLTMEDPQREKIIKAMTYVRNFQAHKIGPPPQYSDAMRVEIR